MRSVFPRWPGLGSHGFRLVFLFCVVCSGGAALAGHRLSLEPGGGRYHANPAKTRGFRQGEKTKQRKQEKRKKKRKTLEDNRVWLYTKVFGPGGRTSAKTLLKRGVLKVKKTEAPKTKEKATKTLPDATPSRFLHRGENCSETYAKTRRFEVEKTRETQTSADKKTTIRKKK